jgi:pyridoxine 5-phosphate synthase
VRTELAELVDMAAFAHELGLEVHAGHGLTYDTVGRWRRSRRWELNIGHFLIGEAIFSGLEARSAGCGS